MPQDRAAPAEAFELVITRVFDAPRRLVFKAWTDPAMLVRWMGPRQYPAVSYRADVRPGGAWRACLRATGDGPDYWQGGVYREVVPDRRLVFTFAWDPPHPAHGAEMLVEIDFADQDDRTRMVFRQTGLPSAAERDGHRGGWTSTFDRLEALLAAAV